MSEININQVANFIKMYRAAFLPKRFEQLKQGYQEVQRLSRLEAPEFNIFRVLQVDRREVKTHSAFLAELLNQHGSHGQQFLFLKAFLSHCQNRFTVPIAVNNCKQHPQPFPYPQLKDPMETHEWEVKTEMRTAKHGQMDIIIRSPDLKFLCVIENKTDAPEGEGQLQSYWNWMQGQRSKYDSQALIFLTPNGRESTACVPYFKFSYHHDIRALLETTLPRIEAVPIRTVVQQYLQLVLTL